MTVRGFLPCWAKAQPTVILKRGVNSIEGEGVKRILRVCVLNTYHDSFDYHTEEHTPMIGTRVLVPFGKKERLGIVLSEKSSSEFKTKPIASVIDLTPVLTTELLWLCEWISKYYQSPLSQVLLMALPKTYRVGKAQEILYTAEELADAALPPNPNALIPLNQEQALAACAIKQHLNKFTCFLLQGVTGSGKTEVYLSVIYAVLAQGKQVLVLVPEIGLTPELIARFKTQLPVEMIAIHSNLNDSERIIAFEKAKQGYARLIVGTRTAIFTPMAHLGLIVIDEEHDLSFKQMDHVRYSARDTALIRAHHANIPIILGSATPSLESLYNAQLNKYKKLYLRQRALTEISTHIELIDLRNQSLTEGLAPKTIEMIRTHLEQKFQVLIFINRRGFSPVLLCHACGGMMDCKQCDTHLTFHREQNKLICHHCGWAKTVPQSCQSCGSIELLPIGIGTQRVLEGLQVLFPDINMMRIDRDEIRGKKAFERCLAKISHGEVQLMVGTQMLAKGHHFPKLTLVVVLDIDGGLAHHDFRSLEKLGQLLIQVAGRAGRAEFPGEVVIQTHQPTHFLLNCLLQQGYESFMAHIMASRKQAQLPPFSHLMMLQAESKKVETVLAFMHRIKPLLQTHDLTLLGPAPSPLARRAGFYRMQLLLKANHRNKLQKAVQALREHIQQQKIDKGLRWYMDVDPLVMG